MRCNIFFQFHFAGKSFAFPEILELPFHQRFNNKKNFQQNWSYLRSSSKNISCILQISADNYSTHFGMYWWLHSNISIS